MNYKWCFIINLIENTFIKNFYKTNPNIVGIYDYNSYYNIYIHTLNSKYFIQNMIFENNETNETTNYYTLCFDKYDIEMPNDNQFDTENCEILGICKKTEIPIDVIYNNSTQLCGLIPYTNYGLQHILQNMNNNMREIVCNILNSSNKKQCGILFNLIPNYTHLSGNLHKYTSKGRFKILNN